MAVGLAAVGTLSYGGHTFDGSTKLTISQAPVYDESGYTVAYVKTTITCMGYIQVDAGADSSYETLRKQLNAAGRKLVLSNKGFGALDINTGKGKMKDVKGGPYPRTLQWAPVGGNAAVEFTWVCEVCLPECESKITRYKGIMSINYEITFDIDEHGDTTRRVSGYIEIAQPRGANRKKLSDSVDKYLNKMTVKAPPGFKRKKTRQLNADRSRMNFSVTDTQIPSPNPYPSGVTAISGRHRLSWRRGQRSSSMYRNTVSMDITPQAGVSGALGWCIFGSFVAKRMQFIIDGQSPGEEGMQWPMLNEVTAEEDLFGRGGSYSASWTYLTCLGRLFDAGAAGLWQPFGGADSSWVTWKTSLAGSMFKDRGTAGMTHTGSGGVPQDTSSANSGEALVDLCTSVGAGPVVEHAASIPSTGMVSLSECSTTMGNKTPPTTSSWLSYDMNIKVTRHRPSSRQTILQPEDDPNKGGVDYEAGGGIDSKGVGYGKDDGTATPDIIQTGGRSQYSAFVVGHAVRCGHKIPRPNLKRIGLANATEQDGEFVSSATGNMMGVPVYTAHWWIHYLLDKSPGDDVQTPKCATQTSPGDTPPSESSSSNPVVDAALWYMGL